MTIMYWTMRFRNLSLDELNRMLSNLHYELPGSTTIYEYTAASMALKKLIQCRK